eukprot:scaffold1221_cov68-Phaeocystis_antarctica.AAC.1
MLDVVGRGTQEVQASGLFTLWVFPSSASALTRVLYRFKSKIQGAREGHATYKIPHKTDEDATAHRTPCRGDHITRMHW